VYQFVTPAALICTCQCAYMFTTVGLICARNLAHVECVCRVFIFKAPGFGPLQGVSRPGDCLSILRLRT